MGVSTVALLTGIVATGFTNQVAMRRNQLEAEINSALSDGVITGEEKEKIEDLRDALVPRTEVVAILKLQQVNFAGGSRVATGPASAPLPATGVAARKAPVDSAERLSQALVSGGGGGGDATSQELEGGGWDERARDGRCEWRRRRQRQAAGRARSELVVGCKAPRAEQRTGRRQQQRW